MTADPRRRRGPIAFMVVWLVIWGAGILVAALLVLRAALSGDLGLAAMLLLWLGAAGLGLYAGLRRLQDLVGLGRPPAPPAPPVPGRSVWRDDLPDRRDP